MASFCSKKQGLHNRGFFLGSFRTYCAPHKFISSLWVRIGHLPSNIAGEVVSYPPAHEDVMYAPRVVNGVEMPP